MELHQIRYFLALCETLNFTRAAEKCNVTQPSLTRAIQGLEAELGGPLFRRERNHSHLTELGRMMRPFLEQVLAQSEAAKKRAKDFVQLKDTPLSLGIMCTIGPARLLGLFSNFSRHCPGVDLQLLDAKGQLVEEQLANGDLDVAIYCLPEQSDDGFHLMPLFTEHFVIAVGPGHRFEQMNAVRIQDLQGERYLSRANCEFADYIRAIARQQGVDYLRPYRSDRDDWIQAMVLAGLGFTFIPEYAVTYPDLVVRPLVEPTITRTVNLATVRGRPHTPAVGAFVREAMRYKWPGSQISTAEKGQTAA